MTQSVSSGACLIVGIGSSTIGQAGTPEHHQVESFYLTITDIGYRCTGQYTLVEEQSADSECDFSSVSGLFTWAEILGSVTKRLVWSCF